MIDKEAIVKDLAPKLEEYACNRFGLTQGERERNKHLIRDIFSQISAYAFDIIYKHMYENGIDRDDGIDRDNRKMVFDKLRLSAPDEALEGLKFLQGDDEALTRMQVLRDKRDIREQLISIGQAQWEDVAEKTEKIYASLSLRH